MADQTGKILQGQSVCDEASGSGLDPCLLVIFGGSGDLTARKLIPALYHLHLTEKLPEPFAIVGCGRTSWNDEQFRNHLRDSMSGWSESQREKWQGFARKLFYKEVDYKGQESARNLADYLQKQGSKLKTGGNLLFYLAVPPSLYAPLSDLLGAAGLNREQGSGRGWVRLVVEKPFGRDLQSSTELNRKLHEHFREHQIFRIDHYLAKETVQNILMFRFANAIFEPVWNRSYVDYVGIIAAEEVGVGHRAGYYEEAGIIRDMFQNHLMQLLALTAMEPPSVFEADRVQDEKVKVFRSLKPFSEFSPEENLILGQYSDSKDGSLPAYRKERGIAEDSRTPTFAMLRLFIDNWRWRGVPFYMSSGKRLARKDTRIVIQFRAVPLSMFRYLLGEDIPANRLTLSIYPNEEINLTFQAKKPGQKVCMQSVSMDFSYGDKSFLMDGYARVLHDCLEGYHMLFWRQDGVEQTWAYLDPVLEECDICAQRDRYLHFYPSGSWGPEESMPWMSRIMGNEIS